MYCNCENCGQSMQQGEKAITQFGLADICSAACLQVANNDGTTRLPYRDGFDSKKDINKCCESALERAK